jgi:hypothetical protein
MKIGAITVLRIAGPDGVAASPASAVVIVVHGRDNVVVDAARFVDRLGDVFCLLVGKLADHAIDGYEAIGEKETIGSDERLAERLDGGLERDAMLEALDVEGDFDVEGFDGIGGIDGDVRKAVAVFLVALNFVARGAFDFELGDSLGAVFEWERKPDAQFA